MIAEFISVLGVAATVYTVHHQLRRAAEQDRVRWLRDRSDRRRERLLLLYAQWSSHLLEVLSLRSALATRPPIRDEQDLWPNVHRLHQNADAATRATCALNQSHFAIALEEGQQLAAEVELLTRETQTWNGLDTTTSDSIRGRLGQLLASKRISYQPKDLLDPSS